MAIPVQERDNSVNINELILTEINSYEYNNDEDDDFIDEVYDEDADHIESFKENNTYYIGLCYKDKRTTSSAIILDMSISTGLFLKYSYDVIYKVLGGPRVKQIRDINAISDYNNWLYYHNNRDIQLQIFKTYFKNLDKHPIEWELGVIIKTFWIRLIQRKWKKIFKERQEIICKRMNPRNLHYRSVHGNWPIGLNYLPSLKDMNM